MQRLRDHRLFLEPFFAVGFAVTFFATFFEAGLAEPLLFADFLTAFTFGPDATGAAPLLDFFLLLPKMDSHPLAYFSLVPTRVIVTVNFLDKEKRS
jgi:hypothetical protein